MVTAVFHLGGQCQGIEHGGAFGFSEAITPWLDCLRGSARKYIRRRENRLASRQGFYGFWSASRLKAYPRPHYVPVTILPPKTFATASPWPTLNTYLIINLKKTFFFFAHSIFIRNFATVNQCLNPVGPCRVRSS